MCALPPLCSYRQRAQKLSEIHKDQPGHPVNRTVYWIDYILRHDGAHHLRAAVHQISFCQYFLLDIVFVLLLGAALFYFLLSWVTKFICRRIRSLWSSNSELGISTSVLQTYKYSFNSQIILVMSPWNTHNWNNSIFTVFLEKAAFLLRIGTNFRKPLQS